jgi:hypothetical protein
MLHIDGTAENLEFGVPSPQGDDRAIRLTFICDANDHCFGLANVESVSYLLPANVSVENRKSLVTGLDGLIGIDFQANVFD